MAAIRTEYPYPGDYPPQTDGLPAGTSLGQPVGLRSISKRIDELIELNKRVDSTVEIICREVFGDTLPGPDARLLVSPEKPEGADGLLGSQNRLLRRELNGLENTAARLEELASRLGAI